MPFHTKRFPKLFQGSWSRDERYSISDMQKVVDLARMRVSTTACKRFSLGCVELEPMSICYVDGAVLQGIRVELELDMPGHAAAWCVGYPELCPLDKGPNSPGCGAPLDVSKNSTFELVDGLVGELHEMFPVSTAAKRPSLSLSLAGLLS